MVFKNGCLGSKSFTTVEWTLQFSIAALQVSLNQIHSRHSNRQTRALSVWTWMEILSYFLILITQSFTERERERTSLCLWVKYWSKDKCSSFHHPNFKCFSFCFLFCPGEPVEPGTVHQDSHTRSNTQFPPCGRRQIKCFRVYCNMATVSPPHKGQIFKLQRLPRDNKHR